MTQKDGSYKAPKFTPPAPSAPKAPKVQPFQKEGRREREPGPLNVQVVGRRQVP